MSENIPSSIVEPERGDSSSGDVSKAQVGTAKLGGVSPLVVPTHKKFSLFLFLLIPILTTIAVISLYVLLQARTMYQQTLPIASPAPSSTPLASADPTADWQTYTNNKYNFSFKYPKNFDYLTEDEDFANGDYKGVVIVQNFPRTKTPNYSDNATFQMLIYVKKDIGDIRNQESLTLYGDHGAYINIVRNGYVYQIDFTLNKTDNTNLPEQILSTFKFTDKSAESATDSWQTYTNMPHNFSIRYPESYQLIEENSEKVTFGFRSTPADDLFPYLTISFSPKYKPIDIPKCDGISQKFPCVSTSPSSSDSLINNVDIQKFDIKTGLVDSDYRIVQIIDKNIEFQMYVAGGGLSNSFDQILSTFKFTD
jgi:hypothetical protein